MLSGQYKPWVNKSAALADLKVKVGSLRIAGVSSGANPLTGAYTLTLADTDYAQVRVHA
jgi:hypothetical protein